MSDGLFHNPVDPIGDAINPMRMLNPNNSIFPFGFPENKQESEKTFKQSDQYNIIWDKESDKIIFFIIVVVLTVLITLIFLF